MSPRKKQIETPVDASITGVIGDSGASRSGDDARKRGWYWHWNAIVTQYAPLIGLKGVGLLNSYTVWTDRREESPTRGYAFPSQQSEADFYGEDRAELITINKILVALDLIEIRKEMVVRPDEHGRRWKVPHNFYRVKDQDDGYTLDGDAVMRVVHLADKDKSVYRYLRHIFSAKFSPIDARNAWAEILLELRNDPTWQKLAARTAVDEQRASERTRAGHASRKDKTGVRTHLKDVSASAAVESVTAVSEAHTSVAPFNNGLESDVGDTNKGSPGLEPTVVAQVSEGEPTIVGPSNRTYYQEKTTTTTRRDNPERSYGTGVFGPGSTLAASDQPGMERALRRFAEANGREVSGAERKILKELAQRFDLSARECGNEAMASGWAWVSAAIYEAVDAGSAYVAPKRVREILMRWEREGLPSPDDRTASTTAKPVNEASAQPRRKRTSPAQRVDPPVDRSTSEPARMELFDAPALPIESFPLGGRGMNSAQVWAAVLDLLRQTISSADVDLWLRPAILLTLDDDERLILGAPNRSAARRIDQRFISPVEHALESVLGQTFTVDVVVTDEWPQRTDDDLEQTGA